jgi:hypothetical protein
MFHLFNLAKWVNGISGEDTGRKNAMDQAYLEKDHGIGKSILQMPFLRLLALALALANGY